MDVDLFILNSLNNLMSRLGLVAWVSSNVFQNHVCKRHDNTADEKG